MAEDTEKPGADGVGNIMVRLGVRNGKRGGSICSFFINFLTFPRAIQYITV
jgi:hypothetical protein